MLSVSEVPSAGRPLSATLRVPPLPLQRESIHLERQNLRTLCYRGIYSAVIHPAIKGGAAFIDGYTPIIGYALPLKRERWHA